MRANDPDRFKKSPPVKVDLSRLCVGDRVFFDNGDSSIVDGSYRSYTTGAYEITFNSVKHPNRDICVWFTPEGLSVNSTACQNIKSYIKVTTT